MSAHHLLSKGERRARRFAILVRSAGEHHEQKALRERYAAEDRAFAEAIAASTAADERCMAALAELPAIRAEYRAIFTESAPR